MAGYGEFVTFSNECDTIAYDIKNQINYLKNSTGDVAECYKKVILDKVWKLCQKQGEFYHKRLNKNMETITLVQNITPQMTDAQWENLLSSISSAR